MASQCQEESKNVKDNYYPKKRCKKTHYLHPNCKDIYQTCAALLKFSLLGNNYDHKIRFDFLSRESGKGFFLNLYLTSQAGK